MNQIRRKALLRTEQKMEDRILLKSFLSLKITLFYNNLSNARKFRN